MVRFGLPVEDEFIIIEHSCPSLFSNDTWIPLNLEMASGGEEAEETRWKVLRLYLKVTEEIVNLRSSGDHTQDIVRDFNCTLWCILLIVWPQTTEYVFYILKSVFRSLDFLLIILKFLIKYLSNKISIKICSHMSNMKRDVSSKFGLNLILTGLIYTRGFFYRLDILK